MKKVLFVSSLYYPHVGGIETMITELARFYRVRNISSIVLTKKWPNSLSDHATYNGVEIYRVTSARTDREFLDIVTWIKKHAYKIKPDIIHVIGARRPLPLIALLLKFYWNIPLVITIAGGDIPDKNDPYPGTVWEESKSTVYPALNHADIITCVSKNIAQDFKYFFPEIKTTIKTLYAGVDIKFIQKASKEKIYDKYIFSLRRLDPTKGIHILIEAFGAITHKYPDLKLVIAGDGSERIKLEDLVKKFGLGDKVRFIGTIDLRQAISILKGAELTVVPSLSEAGGLINIEAQAAGCPVVATNVGGIPEYIKDGVSGLLCVPGDAFYLAETIMRVLDNHKLRRKLIRGGLGHARELDWEILAPQYLKLYQKNIKILTTKELPEDFLFQKMWINLSS